MMKYVPRQRKSCIPGFDNLLEISTQTLTIPAGREIVSNSRRWKFYLQEFLIIFFFLILYSLCLVDSEHIFLWNLFFK